MMKFNVGDILKTINKVGSRNLYVLIVGREEANPIYATPVYKVISLVTNREHTWNTNHVDSHYERVS